MWYGTIDTILFDLDETLLDREASLRAFALWQAKGMLRNSINDEHHYCERFIELDSNGSVWKDKVYAKLLDEFDITDWTVDELLESYMLCFCGFCQLIPNAGLALETLEKLGYKLGIVSNGKSPFQERNFNALGINHLIDTVVISEAVGYRKPEPEIFEMACKSLHSSPQNAVFVGDNPEADIQGASRLGMYTVYIPRFYGKDCTHADAICTDYSQLVDIVQAAS